MEPLTRILEFLLSPVGIMTLSMACGVYYSLFRRKSPLGRRFLLAGVLLLFLYTFSPMAELSIRSLELEYPPTAIPGADAGIRHIVVLAGYAEEDPAIPVTSRVSAQTLCCLAESLRLHRLLPDATVIASGGVLKDGEPPVAAVMVNLLEQVGLPRSSLLVEGSSTNTYENFVEVKKILGRTRFILVAAACDLPRAMAVARKLEMNAIAAPACIWTLKDFPADMPRRELWRKVLESFASPSLQRLRYLQWAHHEYLGYLWYRLLSRV